MSMAQRRPSDDLSTKLFYALVSVFTLNVLSAVLFLSFVRWPVYDDASNIFDAHAYATRGVSVSAIQEQRNAPGPASFIWMAFAIRLIGHDELLDARISVLFSWLLLVFLMFLGARMSEWTHLWYGAVLAALIFPHSLTATATVLTEGPALLFSVLGALAWTEWSSRESRFSWGSLPLGILGGLSIGLAVTCRQYYLALLPAAGLLAFFPLEDRTPKQTWTRLGEAVISLGIAVLPVLALVLVWRGITSPSTATGASYYGYQAKAGLAWFRPADVAFYVAVYLVPLSFPAIKQIPRERRTTALLASLVVGLIVSFFRDSVTNPGPLNSLLAFASRIPGGAALLLWLITAVATYNAIAVSLMLWRERSKLRACAPAIFAVFVVLFFIAEQLGAGGNIPFYDRYVIQLAPFLGLIAFWLFPTLTRTRILVMVAMSLISHAMLWRYAFIST
jgi:hypothetical protein